MLVQSPFSRNGERVHTLKRINPFKAREVDIVENNPIPLHQVPLNSKAVVSELNCYGSKRRRMLDLGLIPETVVEAVQISPVGDPKAYFIRGAVIALREEEASKVMVNIITN